MNNGRIGSELLLKMAVIICLCYSAIRSGEFISSRIPPYKEGQCLQPMKISLENVIAKVEKNYIIKGYSDLAVIYEGYKIDTLKVTFEEQRNSESKFLKINCN